MVRIHADGSTDTSLRGISMLVPAWHKGWTDDIYTPSLRAGRLVQKAVVASTGALNRGIVRRSDLTGFNWANVPAILVETGFLTNANDWKLLHTPSYQQRVARGLTAGVAGFVKP
jgi:N-acetylmuramoyl-L-alanine amidase